MRVDQLSRRENGDIFFHTFNTSEPRKANLLLVNGSSDLTDDWDWFIDLKLIYPKAHIISTSRSFTRNGKSPYQHYLEATAIEADNTRVEGIVLNLNDDEEVSAIGRQLAEKIDIMNLQYLVVFSHGNGSVSRQVKESINEYFEDKTIYTGGLAWSSYQGATGFIGLNEDIREGNLVALAFYADGGINTNGEMDKLISYVGRKLLPENRNGNSGSYAITGIAS